MNAIGMYPELGQQMKEIRLSEGDKVLLLTDGFLVIGLHQVKMGVHH